MVGKIGFDVARTSMSELIDTGLEPEELDNIRDTIQSVNGVENLHLLRTRRMGGHVLVDVHLILSDPRVSVSEGHQISETVRGRLIARIDDVEDVTVHIDPEDDEHVAPGRHLGLRRHVMERLEPRLGSVVEAAQIRRVNLHYLGGQLDLELELPLDLASDRERLEHAFERALADESDVASVRLLFS